MATPDPYWTDGHGRRLAKKPCPRCSANVGPMPLRVENLRHLGWKLKKRIEEFHGERGHCPCMFGLVILPSGEEIQKQVLVDFKALEQQLSFKKQSITWKDVHQKNYMVRVVKKGKPQVTELPLCVDCRAVREAPEGAWHDVI